MARALSCGVLVLRAPGELLLCHATHRRYWDLPKGLAEPNEVPADAAARELLEETGLAVAAERLRDLGRHRYLRAKDLHLFALDPDGTTIEISSLHCTSTFRDPKRGITLPEVDSYRFARRTELEAFCIARMTQVLQALTW